VDLSGLQAKAHNRRHGVPIMPARDRREALGRVRVAHLLQQARESADAVHELPI
jgi:hypothetical protein